VRKIVVNKRIVESESEICMAGGELHLFQVQKSCRILRDFYSFSYSKGEAWNKFHEISSKIFVE
jgi:hypothetical protein